MNTHAWTHDAGDHVAALAWLLDGRTLAVAPAVGGMVLLDRATGEVLRTLAGHAPANCALSVADGLLASAGQDGLARLWQTDNGELAHELRTSDHASDWCEHAQFSPDGALLATTAGCASHFHRANERRRAAALGKPRRPGSD